MDKVTLLDYKSRIIVQSLDPDIYTTGKYLPEYLLNRVAHHVLVPQSAITGKTRSWRNVLARYLYMLCMFRYSSFSIVSISHYCGWRDHTTVLHGLHTLLDWLETDDPKRSGIIRALVHQLDAELPICRRKFQDKRDIDKLL